MNAKHIARRLLEDEDISKEDILDLVRRSTPTMKMYTVIGFYEETGQIFSDHVEAEDGVSPFAVVARQREDATFVACLQGAVSEDHGISFPGEGLVDAETILEQTDVFPPPP